MAASSESHSRRNEDVVASLRNINVLDIVNNNGLLLPSPKGNVNGLEAFFLPHLIPIFIWSLCASVCDTDIGQEKVLYCLLHLGLVPIALLNISNQLVLRNREGFEPNLRERCGEDISSSLAERLQRTFHFVVLHLIYIIKN